MTDQQMPGAPAPGQTLTAAVRVDGRQITDLDGELLNVLVSPQTGATIIVPVLEPEGEGAQPGENVLVLRITTSTPLHELAALLHIAAAGLDDLAADAGRGTVNVKSIEVQE